MVSLTTSASVFACYSAACRPPTSGGTGGSGGKAGKGGRGASGGGASGGSSDGVSIVGGKATVGGKAITNNIVKRGNSWVTTMRGKEFSHRTVSTGKKRFQDVLMGKTKKEVAEEAAKKYAEALAQKQVTAISAARRASGIRTVSTASDTTLNRAARLPAAQQLKLKELGRTNPSKVVIGRDGSAKINGKATDVYKVTKAAKGGYHISGVTSRSGEYTSSTRFKDHAAVKRYIAREVNAVADVIGD
jgi:hypothetical protein